MCGIAGILQICSGPDPAGATPQLREWGTILDRAIARRGPDGAGSFSFTPPPSASPTRWSAHLLHRRLSIIDPATGIQPLHSADGSCSVVFNGCIYNHRTLRAELASAGSRFLTDHSDTEVLPNAWLRWRERMFERLDGMFALALLTPRELVLARDPYGEKPLFILTVRAAPDTTFLAFASAVTPLLELRRAIAREFSLPPMNTDHLAMREWVKFGFSHRMPFDELRAVRPGTAAVLDLSHAPSVDLAWAVTDFSLRRTHARIPELAEIDGALARSVHSRLEADVPMGCFLSGGIDSALVAALAAQRLPQLPAFTVRMPDPALDESADAAHTARALGLPHHILDCEPDPAADLTSLLTSLGLPLGDSSLLPAAWVARAARRHITVALGGDGGDELFMGYDRHASLKALFGAAHAPRALSAAACRALSIASTARARARAARLLGAAARHSYNELTSIFPGPLGTALGIADAPAQPLAPDFEHFADTARAWDLHHYLAADLLAKSDTASMAAPIELRCPLLGRELGALLANAPTTWLLSGGRKWVLRNLAARHLPASVLCRPKRGFAIPIGRWFRDDYGGLGTLLADTFASADPWPSSLLGFEISRPETDRMLRSHLAGSEDHSQRLYHLLVLSIWCGIARG